MKRLRNILLLAFILNGWHYLPAGAQATPTQDVCSQMIGNANVLYNDGYFESCIDMLEKVLSECRLSRSQRENAMELLAKSYVEIKDQDNARAAVERLLKEYPHYELKEEENFESYNNLVKKYRVHPLLSVGARNVIIWVGYNTLNFVKVPDGVISGNPYSGGNYFFSYYGWAELEFDKNISINGDLMWWTSYFERKYTREPDLDLSYSENPIFVEIPIYAKKYFPVGSNLKPYVAAGIGWLYMTKATGFASKYNSTENMNYRISNIDMLDMRNRNNFEWVAGFGVGYKLKNVRLFFDTRYYGGLTSITDPDRSMSYEKLVTDYYYSEAPLKMNKFEIGVSISYTFINSVKRVK